MFEGSTYLTCLKPMFPSNFVGIDLVSVWYLDSVKGDIRYLPCCLGDIRRVTRNQLVPPESGDFMSV